MEAFVPTERTTLKRLPRRASYDREVVYRVLDEGFVCHLGFAIDGQPYVIPTAYGRVGDTLYLHASAASRTFRALSRSIPVCATVTLLDGLVLARSAFHHSLNYRSVVVLGEATPVEASDEKIAALRAFTEHVIPGRWADVRGPNAQELKSTGVLALPLTEVSAKVRTGPPIDDEADMAIPVWAGELPLRVTAGPPVPDPRLPAGITPPAYVTHYPGRDRRTPNWGCDDDRGELHGSDRDNGRAGKGP
jgi:nitroimidazol reductase NimA-like FMN-containing flavoprotein (pyridoxamine 5'-phosphate oxidase superfamily)